jgi:hypothetical protein
MATTDLDTAGIVAVRAYVRSKAFLILSLDRAKYEQYSQNPGNTDITPLSIAAEAQMWRQEYRDAQNALRIVRKVG